MNDIALSERDLATINERLFHDCNGQIPLITVIRVLRECAARKPHDSAELVERATRIKLQIHRQRQG
jgi:hypothetical protein